MPAPARSSGAPAGTRADLLSVRRGDQLALRRQNLSIVLRHLRDAGPRSRARIAGDTGLNKATVSSLVADLAERGLVRDGAQEVGTVGRPGTSVELDGAGICGIGVEISVDYLSTLVVDLTGRTLVQEQASFDVARTSPATVLDELARMVTGAVERAAGSGVRPMGLTLAVPGLVDASVGALSVAPNLRWDAVPVAQMLIDRLDRPGYPVLVDNEANLAALGEFTAGSVAGTADLVLITGEVGLGGGVIAGGRLVRGVRGFGGEVGHMPLDPQGLVCGCGRRGCWETLAGLSALLGAASDSDDQVRNPDRDLTERLGELVRRAERGDRRTLGAFEQVGGWLGVGASVLLNVLNPGVLVLGGYFAVLGPWLLEPMTRELSARVIAPKLGGCRIELSTLGFSAAARGGAQLALETVIDDPTLVAPALATRLGTTPEHRTTSQHRTEEHA